MKKIFLTAFLSATATASALAQGSVIFENALSPAPNAITIGPNTGPASYAAAGSYTAALLWAPGTSQVPQSGLTQIAIYGLATGEGTQAGFFFDPHAITTGNATGPRTPAIFEVQAWIGNYTSYSAAVAAGAYVGQSAEFVNNTGDPRPPATPPVQTTGWDGNVILVIPEPGTLAIGALAAASLLFFRRRK